MQTSDSKNSNRLKENQDSQQKTGSIVSSTTSTKGEQEIKESELFKNAMVNGVQSNLLLDTGATLTIPSDRLHAEIVKSGENGLVPVTQKTVGADGTPLIVQGRGIFSIKLGQREFSSRLDFLQTNQCLVDVCKTRMYVHVVEHELDLQGNIGCFRVSLCETISIPPRS